MIDQAQAWLDFLVNNGDKLMALVVLALAIAGLIRAQVLLWRADKAGAAVTSAVTASGSERAVRAVMDRAPPKIKETVKGWLVRR